MIVKDSFKSLCKFLVIATCFTIYSSTPILSQNETSHKNTLSTEWSELDKGVELYNRKLYSSAISEFNKVVIDSDQKYSRKYKDAVKFAKGYIVLSKIKMENPNLEASISEYVKEFPNSHLNSTILYTYGSILFDKASYADAYKYFSQVRKKSLTKKEQNELTFREGYSLMRIGENDQAEKIFKEIIDNQAKNESQFIYPTYYYLGYIYYSQQDFEKATPLFELAKSDARFTNLALYHILEGKFMEKDYDYVIENGGNVYGVISDKYKPRVARILSETYYAVNDPIKAKYYYEIYSINSSDVTKTDNYYAGMISYSLKSYISAIDAFSKVASELDSIGQSAYYYIGNSYIQLKNKHAALNAFKRASSVDFDKSIQEDAFFNYAKLTFDLNRDITPFNQYLSQYPTNIQKWDEIYNYMSTAFILNSDYARAINMLENVRRPTAATFAKVQKAAFLRAMQLIDKGAFSDAIPFLQLSIKNGSYNEPLNNVANFWLSECYFRGDKYQESLDIIKALESNISFKNSDEFPTLIYNKAYTYFKMGNYVDAIDYFIKYYQLPFAKQLYADEAKIRLADAYFMNKEYQNSAELFEKITIDNAYKELYPLLQGATAYGLVGNNLKKEALLKEVNMDKHYSSPLYTSAIYELGRVLVQSVKDEEAASVLNTLIENPKDSTYYYKALLEMGLISSNMQKPETALEYYRTIIEENPISEEGESALAGMERVYQAQNDPQAFFDYLDKVGLSTVKTPSERESMLFNSAEQVFLGRNYAAALNSLKSFIAKHPAGPYTLQAQFYIAECYKNSGDLEQAATAYYNVMMNGEGAFSEIATLNYGRISYELQRYKEAVKAYETLDKIAIINENKNEAKIGLMRSYYHDNQFENAIENSNLIIASPTLGKELITEANYIKGKSLLSLGEREAAIAILTELATDPTTLIGAEATYLLISDTYDSGDFEKVEQMVFNFSDSKSPQTYWIARSFITLGDSYMDRDNQEQAIATFNSIKDNYKSEKGDNIEELLNLRLNKLNSITQQESSNTPESNNTQE